MRSLTLIIPLPPAEIGPNNRSHWAKKHRLTSKYKQAVWLAIRRRVGYGWGDTAKYLVIQPTLYFPCQRRRDMDNMAGSLKAAYDALVEYDLIEDDHRLLPMPPLVKVDKDDPRVELRIVEVDGEGYLAALDRIVDTFEAIREGCPIPAEIADRAEGVRAVRVADPARVAGSTFTDQ